MKDSIKNNSNIAFLPHNICTITHNDEWTSKNIEIVWKEVTKYSSKKYLWGFLELKHAESVTFEPYYIISENNILCDNEMLKETVDNMDNCYLKKSYSNEYNSDYYELFFKAGITITLNDQTELYLFSTDYVQILRCKEFIKKKIKEYPYEALDLDHIQELLLLKFFI